MSNNNKDRKVNNNPENPTEKKPVGTVQFGDDKKDVAPAKSNAIAAKQEPYRPQHERTSVAPIQENIAHVSGRIAEIKENVSTYINMFNAAQNLDQKAAAQIYYFNLMKSILNVKSMSDFRAEWVTLLNEVFKARDSITPMTMMQGAEVWPLGEDQYNAYRTLAWVVYRTADAKKRRDTSDFDAGWLLKVVGSISKNATEKIAGFYNL